MKLLKLSLLIISPILLAAMLGNAAHTITDHLNLLDQGQNYLPLFCAISFFAALFFFVITANIIYPDNIATIPEHKEENTIEFAPVIYSTTSENYHSNSLYHSINLG